MNAKYILEKAPLVHAIIHLRFSKLPQIKEDQVDFMHRALMELGFPDYIPSRVFSLELDPSVDIKESMNVATGRRMETRHIFRAPGQTQLVRVTETDLILKATKYGGFEDFRDTFERVLEILEGAVDSFTKTALKWVGLRYVDLVVPSPNSSGLAEYVKPHVLPNVLTGHNMIYTGGVSFSSAETGANQSLKLVFEEVATEGRVTKVIPDNLIETDPNAVMLIQGYPWWANLTAKTYGIMDIDHQYAFADSPGYARDTVIKQINALHDVTSDVFWGSLTEKAENEWGKRKV
ncbi:MAG: TIGR04255 family protein [Gammaproteobacteria bacterium]|nr:TIGR04255 family protein [Gammaproteobacteria bacterium]